MKGKPCKMTYQSYLKKKVLSYPSSNRNKEKNNLRHASERGRSIIPILQMKQGQERLDSLLKVWF